MRKITGAVPNSVFMKPKKERGMNKLYRKNYKRRMLGRNIALFTFDDNGEYLIEDESKFTDDVMLKIKKLGYKVEDMDKKPIKEEKQLKTETNELQCDVCGFIAKNKGGLSSHKKKHG